MATELIIWVVNLKKGNTYGTDDFPTDTVKLELSKGNRIPILKVNTKGKPVLNAKTKKTIYYETDMLRGVEVVLKYAGLTPPTNNPTVFPPFIWQEGVVLDWDSNITIKALSDGIVICKKVVV